MNFRILGIIFAAVLILMPFTSYGLGQADIAVIDVGVDSKCNWVVTMKNVGNTQLPVTAMDQYYGGSIQIMINGANNSGWRFSSPLKLPGSVATFSNSGTPPISGTVTLGATYNANGSYEDTNLSNNTLSRVVSCTPPPKPQPDLTITSLDFAPDCRPHIKIANIGTLPISDWYYSRIYLQRSMDNVPAGQLYINTISPNGALKMVQGTADFMDGADYVPQTTLRYDIDISGVVLEDANFNNNSATANLPDRCKPGVNIKKVLPKPPNVPVQKPIQNKLP